MESDRLVREKIRQVYEAVEHVGFDVALDWITSLSYPYYRHFNNADYVIRKGAIFSFLGMVVNHYYKSTWTFGPETNSYVISDRGMTHDISIFIKEFMNHYSVLKKDFPITVFFVIKFLFWIDNEKSFEIRFANAKYPECFTRLRKEFFENFNLNEFKYYSEIKEELGFPERYF